METLLPKIICVVGPTASGKTDLAIVLAKKFNGEIVCADSRQLYKGMAIGSDIVIAPGIKHHLFAFRSPAKPLTLAEYKALALRRIKDILRRGKLPILVGGTGLYISAVADGFEIPQVAPDMAWREKMAKKPVATLYHDLLKKDPAYASRISPQNHRYIIRALEVHRATGKPFSEAQSKSAPQFEVLKLGVARPKAQIAKRIDKRVDLQIKRGLVEETKRLGRRYGWSVQPMTGLGHRQIGMYLREEISLEEAIQLIKSETRKYAKRQIGWFKRDKAIHWVKGVGEAQRLAIKNNRI